MLDDTAINNSSLRPTRRIPSTNGTSTRFAGSIPVPVAFHGESEPVRCLQPGMKGLIVLTEVPVGWFKGTE